MTMKEIAFIIFSIMVFQAANAQGNAAAGRSKAAVCAACHGPDGNSVTPEWPKIAGQHPGYIIKQLTDFKSGARRDPTMSPIAASLSDQDIADLSIFYAAQERTQGLADPEFVKAGARLYRGGNVDNGVPACMACHGPRGAGNPAAGFPALNGQHASYTAAQLGAYKSGKRGNDEKEMMRTIAKRLTDTEIQAVSSYIDGLH
jgi:cytochrome c553